MGNVCSCQDERSSRKASQAKAAPTSQKPEGAQAPQVGSNSPATAPLQVQGAPISQSMEEMPPEHLASPAVLDAVKEVCDTSILAHLPVTLVIPHFLAYLDVAVENGQEDAEMRGFMTREEFNESFNNLINLNREHLTVEEEYLKQQMSVEMINKVYDVLDKDQNGSVDRMELCAGLAIICKGTPEEKIHSVFSAFDTDKDGKISKDEMFNFLYSVFITVMTPEVTAQIEKTSGLSNLTAEQLAGATTEDAFKAFDHDDNGTLDLEEFTEWYMQKQKDDKVKEMGTVLKQETNSFNRSQIQAAA